jgi:hypothetical protein
VFLNVYVRACRLCNAYLLCLKYALEYVIPPGLESGDQARPRKAPPEEQAEAQGWKCVGYRERSRRFSCVHTTAS